jgi:hypothetical protein
MIGKAPIGEPVDWTPARRPQRSALDGRLVRLRPVDPDSDAEPLFRSSHPPAGDSEHWTYLPYGPYADAAALRARLEETAHSEDPLFLTITKLPEDKPAGVASYLRITPEHGTIEIGHIWFGAELRQSTAATEASSSSRARHSTGWATGASSGSATRSTRRHVAPQSVSDSASRGCSVSTRS